jgi:hypothetical protein
MNDLASQSDDSRPTTDAPESAVGRSAGIRKFRGHRIAVTELGNNQLVAIAHHESIGTVEATVQNV